MTFTSWAFWKAALERAAKTVAQTAIPLIGTSATGIFDINWYVTLSIVLTAGVLSLLMSIGSDAITHRGPSLADEVVAPTDADLYGSESDNA